jgi:DNA primase
MSRSVIDEIKARLDIVEVVGQYVTLKRSGRNYKALCPFHNEKTPSFFVFPDTGTWRCFGACGTGGDIFSFVEKKENLPFADVYRMLAQKAGVDIDQYHDPKVVSKLNRLRELNHLASSYFHHQLLHGARGAEARAYLQRREINDETIERFQIGFAPLGWDNLISYLRDRDYSLDDLESAGLVIRRDDGGGYDRFRERVIVPIRNIQGQVIGFGGRILGDGEPKYLNTPQTPLFDKSSVVFALDVARRNIRAQDQVVLVEGYMDVISAHQRGFKNVVAAMGTSITAQQLKTLRTYASNFIFALDADAAGMSATLRSIHVVRETLSSQSVPVPTAQGRIRHEPRLDAVVKIAALPPGKDPDDVLREDAQTWQRLIDNATPLVDYYFAQTAGNEDMSTAQGKAHFVKQVLPIISEIDDPIERRHYISRLATIAGVTEREIDNQLEKYARSVNWARRRREQVDDDMPAFPDYLDEEGNSGEGGSVVRPSSITKSHENVIEERILAYLLVQPDLLSWTDDQLADLRLDPLNAEDFESTVNRAIFDAQHEFLYSDATELHDALLKSLDPALHAAFTPLWTQAQAFDEMRGDQLRKDIVDILLRLRHRRTQQACRTLQLAIRDEEGEKEIRTQLGLKLISKTKEKGVLDKARAKRSHSAQWVNDHQRYAPKISEPPQSTS